MIFRSVFQIFVFVLGLLPAALILSSNADAQVVAPSCPPNYVFSGSQCVLSAGPSPSCPPGFTFSGGGCVQGGGAPSGFSAFIITKALGVSSALDLDGATICVVTGSPGEAAVNRYFRTNRMRYSPMPLNAVETKQAYENGLCDVLTVQNQLASSTLSRLSRPNSHHILPERIRHSTAATPPVHRPPPVYRPAPVARLFPREIQANLWGMGCLTGNNQVVVDGVWGQRSRNALRRFYQLARVGYRDLEPTQAALDAMNNYRGSAGCATQAPPTYNPSPPVNTPSRPVKPKIRCSKVKFGFTRGNTCACTDNRIFTGTACVKPVDRPWQPGECRVIGGEKVCS